MKTRAVAENRQTRLRAMREEQTRIRRGALEAIRRDIAGLKERRKSLLERVRAHCAVARERVKERVRVRRITARDELAREVAEMRVAERNRCKLRLHRVNAETETAIARKRRAVEEERRSQVFVRRVEAHKKAERRRYKKEERSAESDDEVRSNVEPELVAIFDAIRSKIRAVPGRSRTESFLHWVHEHPDEVWSIREQNAQVKLRALLREERRAVIEARKAERALRACGGRCAHLRKRAAASSSLEPAPF